ncbi:LacI family transcriptional regulator [Mycoplasma sp. ES3157-GEN-MYC]|uniref:LacI family DNA-binding transcriptional regulator n=1 Tax=Mycoplasma miroungigenitalium TaxID=754515 RepID=A0A6M4JBP0_9MOLU|nr:LacI family DNA-binding transcriptional regulator [Mycoplasma miroungigenitalium]MBU4690403.1 LacI family transcriptional regulator [Mycoplasma miroungigenitalium]MBU4691670.1 LacI family transcriptional regulator [Mycoplasma miroungigenitalium]QJR43497.1 LacI family DNA-binding transcriptional regulator [Mycoplasma miroungigenitalium]
MRSFSYKDISKLAKVSISTVSRYYNGGYVSKKTRAKIDKVVKEHGYYPNNGARLIKGRSRSIFIIVPEWYENSYTHIMNGIEQGAKKRNKKVFITHSAPEQDEYIETIKYCMAWKPNAIVFFLPKTENEQIIKFIREQVFDSITVVYGEQIEGVNWVDVDVENAFYSVTKTFSDYIEPNQQVIYADDNKLSPRQRELRFSGFHKACDKMKIQYERYFVENKKIHELQKFQKFLIDNKHSNVVCSTHETFINLVSSNDNQLRLTDIGFQSIYDTQKKYKTKIFIDYRKIGEQIEKMIFDTEMAKFNDTYTPGETLSNLFKPMIITQK